MWRKIPACRCSTVALSAERMRVPMLDILSGVAAASGETLDDLRGPCRARALSRARQVAYFLGHEQGYPLPRIGRAVGGRDHTTVLHGLRLVARLAREDPEIAGLIEEARASALARVLVRAPAGGAVEGLRAAVQARLASAPAPVLARVAGVLGVV